MIYFLYFFRIDLLVSISQMKNKIRRHDCHNLSNEKRASRTYQLEIKFNVL